MIYDIQPASILKRISAFILDIILLATIAVGISYLVSIILKVDSHQQVLQDKYTYYEETYNVKFNLTQEEIDALSEEEKAAIKEQLSQIVSQATDESMLWAQQRIDAEQANLEQWERKLQERREHLAEIKAQRVEDILTGEAEQRFKLAKKRWKKEIKELKKSMK